jgi:hypothetical protein
VGKNFQVGNIMELTIQERSKFGEYGEIRCPLD